MNVNSINTTSFQGNTLTKLTQNNSAKVRKAIIKAAGVGSDVKAYELKDVFFKKGVAKKGIFGKKFTGIIADKTKDGNFIALQFKNGVLETSQLTKLNGTTTKKTYDKFTRKGSLETRIRTFTNGIFTSSDASSTSKEGKIQTMVKPWYGQNTVTKNILSTPKKVVVETGYSNRLGVDQTVFKKDEFGKWRLLANQHVNKATIPSIVKY